MMHILNITMAFSEIQTKISTYLEKSVDNQGKVAKLSDLMPEYPY